MAMDVRRSVNRIANVYDNLTKKRTHQEAYAEFTKHSLMALDDDTFEEGEELIGTILRQLKKKSRQRTRVKHVPEAGPSSVNCDWSASQF